MENASGYVILTQLSRLWAQRCRSRQMEMYLGTWLVFLFIWLTILHRCLAAVGSWSCEVVEKLEKPWYTWVPLDHIKPFRWICWHPKHPISWSWPISDAMFLLDDVWTSPVPGSTQLITSGPRLATAEEFVRSSGHDSQRAIFPNGGQSRCEALEGLCILSGYESKWFLEARPWHLELQSFAKRCACQYGDDYKVLIYCKALIMGTLPDPLGFEGNNYRIQ